MQAGRGLCLKLEVRHLYLQYQEDFSLMRLISGIEDQINRRK